ncbi:hypothetical protein GCM10011374_03350 [Kocuria dechangensis]|uniref:Uncharacterized protein n=1 Tax=Kocuria dechangensis TaxID=1176249 RepID=A0A917GFY1_9MICC|nr:hypothetical protein [Kocuria dechangensis]GGG44381.1 hypothetical protein GCM10011374_03350 [Kocuria dechangensis]
MSTTMFDAPACPADWKEVDAGELYEGPAFWPRKGYDPYGVAVMWTPQGYAFSLLENTDSETLTLSELLSLRTCIDQAIRAHEKLDS